MGKKKYNKWIETDHPLWGVAEVDTEPYTLRRQGQNLCGKSIPREMLLPMWGPSAFFLGLPSEADCANFVGIPMGVEGNIMVVGGNGSGKSAGIAKPTLRTWRGAICATDIKGELSEYYVELYRKGFVTRPYIIFDPTQPDGPSYDPFWWLLQDDSNNLVNNIQEIALAIIPIRPDEKEPFWTETERGVLAAALLYYFKLGLSFSQAMCVISRQPLSSLCTELAKSCDSQVQMFLGEMANMKDETLAAFDRGLRNKIMLFATDPYVSHMFRGSREGAECFTWDDLNRFNIFFRIPAHRIEQWSGAINLMYTQLIRYLERRPEMHSPEGAGNIQTLLLMDEFPRFGKLEMIIDAMSTLRSKNVNICLMIQSIAQLDKIYGEHDRRNIFDNCQHQVILRANDAETQKYLADRIGTHIRHQWSVSEHEDDYGDITGYSKQLSEIRELVVQPHELSTLDDVLLLTPHGFCRAEKFRLYDERMKSMLLSEPDTITVTSEVVGSLEDPELQEPSDWLSCTAEDTCNKFMAKGVEIMNKGAKIMSIDERAKTVNKRIVATERQRRQEERAAQDEQKKKDSHRNYIIGEQVMRYFPSLRKCEPGTAAENRTRFESLEAFLYVLSTDCDLVRELQERAAQLVAEDPDGEWRSLV